MLTLLLVICLAVCAFQAIRVKRLLQAAIWLAAASALTSLLLYLLAAPQAAVIELSVGAGLVFILFVFAINLSPGEAPSDRSVVPIALAVTMIGCLLLLLGELVWPLAVRPVAVVPVAAAAAGTSLSSVLWHDRQLDVLVQVALIFVGALTIAGLLAPERQTSEASTGQAQATPEKGGPERVRPVPPIPAKPAPARPRPVPAAFTPAAFTPPAAAPQKEKIA